MAEDLVAPESRQHIEALRDLLPSMKADAPDLYRYGGIGGTLDTFRNLSSTDRRRLLALALTGHDPDLKNVASYLMSHLEPAPASEVELLSQLSSEDRREAEANYLPGVWRAMSPRDAQRIRGELEKAGRSLAGLKLESAFWILIPPLSDAESTWLESVGGGRCSLPAGSRLADTCPYYPDIAERCRLFERMRGSLWVLDVHNHPNGMCVPSPADVSAACYWKGQRPELGLKMKFFIVAGERIAEYDGTGLVQASPFATD